MRDKTVYKAYQQGAQYGKFGSGDHVSEGGSVVKGVSGPIHIMAGVESDIMKEHGPEGEYILAQKKGYTSFDEVPINDETGYKQYGKIGDAWDWLAGPNSVVGKGWGALASVFGYTEEASKDPDMGISTFNMPGEADVRNRKLADILKTQVGSAISGQEEMSGFIDEQLAEQKIQFGAKREQFDTQTTGVQQSMGQYGGARDIQKKTGLITDTSPALETMETQGEMQMENIGAGRTLLASQERGAETQADIDKAQGKQRTQTALASMLTDFMSATGETIDESYIDMFTDYMEGVEGFDVEDYV